MDMDFQIFLRNSVVTAHKPFLFLHFPLNRAWIKLNSVNYFYGGFSFFIEER